MRASTVFLGLALSATVLVAQTPSAKTLDIYVIDTEGGNATLFVSPSGGSLLFDTGNRVEGAARDANRIMAAVRAAGLTQIDYLVTTHWHVDHFGGMAELAAMIPIRNFLDHGPNVDPNEVVDTFLSKTYPGIYSKAKHTIVKPGDTIPVTGLDVKVLSSAGHVIERPLPGAGQPNPSCASFKPQDVDKTENAQSVGSLITFGKFRALYLGDLTWNKDFDLMCPNNRIGTVDLLVVPHHGRPDSSPEVLMDAIHSRVGIMNNGPNKGGEADTMKVLHSTPGLEDLWQLHFSRLSGQEYTVPGMFIANSTDQEQATVPVAPAKAPTPGPNEPPAPVHNGTAYWIKVSAQSDGTFTVTNGRNGFSKTYRMGTRAARN